MNPRLRKVLLFAIYPAFYLFCLVLFGYWTFPYDRLKDRLIAEFDKQQRSSGSAQRLEVDAIGPYWLSGVSARGVRLITPQAPTAEGTDKPPTEIAIDEAHVRVSILPLVIGRMTVTFYAKAFGGSIEGWTRASAEERHVEIEIEGVEVARIDPLVALVGLPLTGTLSGKAEVSLPEQKVAKATGTMSWKITDLAAGDGKAKIGGKIALPKLNVGELMLAAEAKEGSLKLTKLTASGADLDFSAEGKMTMRDPFTDSLTDVNLRFKFSDGYKGRNDMTKSLFGGPGSSMPALFELNPRIKQSKRSDGFYGWRMTGPLRGGRFDPSPAGAAGPVPAAPGAPKPMRGFGE